MNNKSWWLKRGLLFGLFEEETVVGSRQRDISYSEKLTKEIQYKKWTEINTKRRYGKCRLSSLILYVEYVSYGDKNKGRWNMEVGSKLKKVWNEKGITQEHAAELLDVISRQTIF